MKYNFDEPTSRYGMDSIKWEQYNDPDIIALSMPTWILTLRPA